MWRTIYRCRRASSSLLLSSSSYSYSNIVENVFTYRSGILHISSTFSNFNDLTRFWLFMIFGKGLRRLYKLPHIHGIDSSKMFGCTLYMHFYWFIVFGLDLSNMNSWIFAPVRVGIGGLLENVKRIYLYRNHVRIRFSSCEQRLHLVEAAHRIDSKWIYSWRNQSMHHIHAKKTISLHHIRTYVFSKFKQPLIR